MKYKIGFYNGWNGDERLAVLPILRAAIAAGELASPTMCSICLIPGTRTAAPPMRCGFMTKTTPIRWAPTRSVGAVTACFVCGSMILTPGRSRFALRSDPGVA